MGGRSKDDKGTASVQQFHVGQVSLRMSFRPRRIRNVKVLRKLRFRPSSEFTPWQPVFQEPHRELFSR